MLLLGPIVVVVTVSFSGDPYLSFPPGRLSLQWYQRFLADGAVAGGVAELLGDGGAVLRVRDGAGFSCGVCVPVRAAGVPGCVDGVDADAVDRAGIVTAISIYFFRSGLGWWGRGIWLAVGIPVVALPVVLILAQTALADGRPRRSNGRRWCMGARVGGVARARGGRGGDPDRGRRASCRRRCSRSCRRSTQVVISLFVAGVQAQTLPVRIWNSLTLEVEPTIAAVSTLLIGVTIVVLLLDLAIRGRLRA